MPKDQQIHGPRQRTVSCRFCRSRKLRCNRVAPCSNCVSRDILCELEYPAPAAPSSINPSEHELLERIRKLEELVEKHRSRQIESAKQHSKRSEAHEAHAQQPYTSIQSPQIQHLDDDVAWLESIYSGQNFSGKIPSNEVVFRICPIQNIMKAEPYINQNTSVSSTGFETSRCVWLPQYPEARILLEKFIQDILYLHHVVHAPSLPSLLDEVYATWTQHKQVKPGNMVLLLGIFASSTFCGVQSDCERGLFSTTAEANSQSPLWIKAIEDVLDIAHRTTRVSIEGIQGIIIGLFVMLNFEGYAPRTKSLFNVAYLLARELGLHYLDHPSNASLAKSAQTEIGRRVWWCLVTSDWCFATKYIGVSQGFYHCHTRQMMVKKPLNINDENIRDGMTCIEQPLSQPTVMSYFLLRVRLAEILRSSIDRTPLIMGHTGGPSYDVVMDIDTELQLLINDIPPFFSMSVADLIKTYQFDPLRAESIRHQGHMLYCITYAQRCIIHFPYFSRGYVDSVYASSREICLQHAHLVIQTQLQLENSGLFTVTRYKSVGLLVAVFMASIILLMDICYNKSTPQQEKQRGEIADALRILEQARHDSDTAARFLDSLMLVLRKHNVLLPKSSVGQQPLTSAIGNEQLSTAEVGAEVHNNATAAQSYSEAAVVSMPMASSGVLGSNDNSSINMTTDRFGNGEYFSSYFNELTESFEQGIDVRNFDWNNIFQGFDSSFI